MDGLFADAPCSACFSFSGRRRPPPPTAEVYSKTTLTEDGRSVTAVAFSPDGTKIVLALDDASARLKDTAGGEGTLLKWEGQPAYSVAFSPDGARIAMATDVWRERMGGGIGEPDRPVHSARGAV